MLHTQGGRTTRGPKSLDHVPPADSHDTIDGPWRIAWIIGVVLIVILTFGSCGQMLTFTFFGQGTRGDIGASLARIPGGLPGTVVVQNLQPASALALSGVHDGERVRLDNPWDDLRMPKVGEVFGLTRLASGKPEHIRLVLPPAAPISDSDKLFSATTPLGNMTIALIGLFVVVRSRGDRAAMLLGTGFALVGPIPPYVWPIPASHVPYWHVPVWAGIDMLPWFLLGFAITYVEKTTGKVPAWQKSVFWLLTGLQALLCSYEITDTLLNLDLPAIGVVRPLNYCLQIAGLALPV